MKKTIFLVVLGVLFTSQIAAAQRPIGIHGWGPRLGYTSSPDQIHGGVQLDIGDIIENFAVMPSIEIGSGDNLTVIMVMADANFKIPSANSSLTPFVGGGIGLSRISFGDQTVTIPGVGTTTVSGGSSSDIGLTVQGGIMHKLKNNPGSIIAELKVGVSNTPDFKITVGWLFGKKAKTP